jgi:GNAT superfamily N-acetyltransferase
VTATVAIRKATSADAEGILRCLRAAFEPYRESYTPDAYRDTVLTSESLDERFASMSVLVAVTPEGTIVGTVAHHGIGIDEGHLRGMAVLPDHAGTGVAEQLLMRAERELGDLRCLRVSLDTTEPLRRAVRFYEKHGYRFSGRVTAFFGMPVFEYAKALGLPPDGCVIR